MRDVFTILIGIIFILSGIFKWHIVLAIFTWRIKPDTKEDVLLIRIVSVVIGVCIIAGYIFYSKG